MGKALDLTGKRSGRLTAIRIVGLDKRGLRLWECQCDCGQLCIVKAPYFNSGRKRSCGCLEREHNHYSNRTHGMTGTRIWTIWSGIKNRCAKTNGKDYHNYKERGITVCEEWQRFEPFYEWAMQNGYDDHLTIERIDGSKGYSPENCKWATWTEQARNRRNNTSVTINGETHLLIEWAEITGIPYGTINCRINRGWSKEDAVTRPVQIHKRSS